MPRTILTHSESVEFCQEIARAAYHGMNEQVMRFVLEMGGWAELPNNFDISSDNWIKAEAAIDRAAQAGNLSAVTIAADEYAARVERFLNGWREIMKKRASNPLPIPANNRQFNNLP